jgi:hypothetical protein
MKYMRECSVLLPLLMLLLPPDSPEFLDVLSDIPPLFLPLIFAAKLVVLLPAAAAAVVAIAAAAVVAIALAEGGD